MSDNYLCLVIGTHHVCGAFACFQMDIDEGQSGLLSAASMPPSACSTPAAMPMGSFQCQAAEEPSGNDDMDISILEKSMSELKLPKAVSFGRRGRNGSSRLASSGAATSHNPYL